MKTNTYIGSDEHVRNARKACDAGRAAQTENRMKRIAEYNENPKLCKECNTAIPYEKKSDLKFCSKRCAAFFNTRTRNCSHSKKTKNKIKSSLLNRSIAQGIRETTNGPLAHPKVCENCGAEFFASRRKLKTCSDVCLTELKKRVAETDRESFVIRGQETIKRLMSEGRWKGWSGQTKEKRSYPEAHVEKLIKASGLSYLFQHQVSRYSLDFAFPEKMMVLEVDGKQHEYPENKAHDEVRDAFLAAQGWTVFRLKWGRGIRTEGGKQEVLDQFNEFMQMM